MDKDLVIVFGISNNNLLGMIRSLGKRGMSVVVLLEPCNLYFCALRYSKYIAKIHFLKNLDEALSILRTKYSDRSEKVPVLTGSDKSAALLDSHYDELREYFVFFNAGRQGRISYFLDKINTFPLVHKSGIAIIPTWHFTGGDDIPNDIIYPCITKGNNSTCSSKSDMVICRSRADLEKAVRPNVDYLVQKFIRKEYELDIIGFSCEHGKRVLLPGVVYKVREFLDRQSLFVRLDDVAKYPYLPLDAIRDLIESIKYEGIFSVELIYSEGKYYFLEVNLRNDAMAYIYSYAGANYPYLWVQYAQDRLPKGFESSVRIKSPIYMMQESDLYTMLEGRFSFWRWIRDFFRTNVFQVLDVADIKPFLYIMRVHVIQVLKRPIRKLGFKV